MRIPTLAERYGRTVFILVLCFAVAFASAAGCEENVPPDEKVLCSRILLSCAATGTKDQQAFEALSRTNPALSDRMARITDLWERPVEVLDELPDGLPEDETLCIVALGYQLNPDGSMRDELLGRLEVLLRAAKKYPRALVACTGGGTAVKDRTATEAGKMAEWLAAQGIDPARLIVEDRSMTTVQNAFYTLGILQDRYPDVRQVAIVSSDYHIGTGMFLFGAGAILGDCGITVTGNAAYRTNKESFPRMYAARALIELAGMMGAVLENSGEQK